MNPHFHGLLDLLAGLLALGGTVTWLGFFLVYFLGSNWRMFPAGRAMLYFSGATSALFLNSTATIWLGLDYPGRDLVRVVLYGLACLASLRLLSTLLSVQRSGRAWKDELERSLASRQ